MSGPPTTREHVVTRPKEDEGDRCTDNRGGERVQIPRGAALARGPDLVLRLLPPPGLLGARGRLRPADRGRRPAAAVRAWLAAGRPPAGGVDARPQGPAP